jgi:N-acetylmuramic acid 6-phosphate etherase
MLTDRGFLLTEQYNLQSRHLERLSPEQLIALMNREDQRVVDAVAAVVPIVAQAVQGISDRLAAGGRLFYVGAGTSGRLGVLDAAECPPTFCTDPSLVQGIIAGGEGALTRSSEGAEDDALMGAQSLIEREVGPGDAVVGITAGGTTPFVHGALQVAQSRGALTIFLACVPQEQVPDRYHYGIRLLVGPEILAGSTRLKAGTATKMVLNMLSTAVMVQLGKVYDNSMVDVAVTNQKLRDRAIRILMHLTDLPRTECANLLSVSGDHVKTALVMHRRGLGVAAARAWLADHRGRLGEL